tara:strand:+ start:286 stop:495 length:210 start_codon:yes stop_codon:yes gene_type:complete
MAKDKDRKNDKRDAKVDKLSAKANLALAKAQKRKWLFLLICAAIAAYVVISKGGINLGGILDKIKGLSP